MIEATTQYAPSVTRELLLAEVERRGWSVKTIDPLQSMIWITNASGKSVAFRGSRPNITGANAVFVSQHKQLAYYFIESLGVSVLPFIDADETDELEEFMRLHEKVVVKPNDLEKSIGVMMNVTDMSSLHKAIDGAKKFSKSVLVQKQISGKHYRVVVIDGEVYAAMRRESTKVIGNGVSTLYELIVAESKNPLRNNEDAMSLAEIDVEKAVAKVSRRVGEEGLQRIVPQGEGVILSEDASELIGVTIDETEIMHPKYKEIAERISREMGLFINGIDLLVEDIAQFDESKPFPLLEVNSMPSLKHVKEGAAARLLDAAFKRQS